MIRIFILIIAFLYSFTSLAWQDSSLIYSELHLSINQGDEKQLSKYFGTGVELVITGNEGVYSQVQAKQIMKDFFQSFPPDTFNITYYGGGKGPASYLIGEMTSEERLFKIFISTIQNHKATLIQQLRIEELKDE
jgi:hypothetical protein